jgi:hypothetical protein
MSDEAVREPNILVCTRCGYQIPDPGNWWDYSGKLIEHMEAAHTPQLIRDGAALQLEQDGGFEDRFDVGFNAGWEEAIRLLRDGTRTIQVSKGGIGWLPTNTVAGAIRLLEHHRPGGVAEQLLANAAPKGD